MKTNNRPMVKEIRYIWITKDGEEISLAFAQDGNGNGDWSVYGYKPTGKTKEIERPMYDTEYIEYLESKINNNKNCNCFIACNDKDVCMYQKLLQENQELKRKIALQQSSYEKEFRELNDKLLKVVEETLLNTWFETMVPNFITEKVALRRQDVNHLMDEIRKAMKND